MVNAARYQLTRPLLWRSQAALEEFCDFRLFQWVRNFAIYAAEFTAAGFDQHETHWLAALRARRGRGIFSHWTLTESGGSATLSVTGTCRRRGGDRALYTGNMAGNRRKSVIWDTISIG